MRERDSSDNRKPYRSPQLTEYGYLKARTGTNRGGANFDGGTPPFNKGTPVVTGGAFNVDPSYYDAASGESDESDVFE